MSYNHLEGQKSPYLLQHVENPVDWYPWHIEAFQKSLLEQKPILLSIGYSTCHWCHVMAHESFENKEIAKIINDHFVAIKVDREERPDIDQIYMSATSMMTGQGGWPLTAFLTPQGKPFYAGTYFPPFEKWGAPGFIDVLNSVVTAWTNQREQLLASSDEITQLLSHQNKNIGSSVNLQDLKIFDLAFQQISSQFDRQHGGFGGSPKFPMGHQLSFLLRYFKRTNNENALLMVESTLKAISKGGIYDHLGGGFHRYSTDGYWHIPHFEKMLYDQALLVKSYLDCYQITGKTEYVSIIRETLEYVLRDLTHPKGGFYTAEDADSLAYGGEHKIEGAFYVWSQFEINECLDQKHAEVFQYVYGVKNDGNASVDPHGEFIGKNIIYIEHTIEEASNYFKLSFIEIENILKESKKQLFERRLMRARPALDDKILTDWNGLMIGVFAQAGCILNDSSYVIAAKKSADFILNNLYLDQNLLHSWCKESSSITAMLNDYTSLINGLLDLYEACFDNNYLEKSKELTEQMILLFKDNELGDLFLSSKNATDLIVRTKEHYDGAIPSGNSGAVYLLVRLYLMTSEIKWMKHSEEILKNFIPLIEKSPSAYTFALSAFDFYNGPFISITMEGCLTDTKLAQMQRVVYKQYLPNKIVMFHPNNSKLRAHVCHGQICKAPTEDISKLEKDLIED